MYMIIQKNTEEGMENSNVRKNIGDIETPQSSETRMIRWKRSVNGRVQNLIM